MDANLVGLDHVQVAAPPGCDEAAHRFYGEVLGLEETPLPPVLRGRASGWFRCGGQEIYVGIQEDFRPARKAHPAFVSRNLDALRERLRGHGLEALEDFSLTDRQRFFVFDPWGDRLEFLQKNTAASTWISQRVPVPRPEQQAGERIELRGPKAVKGLEFSRAVGISNGRDQFVVCREPRILL